ncbi:alanine racemase [Polynucleobacter necessarius]|uniref:alanine racemase n=1 Tax=Polynucleobacter necessarius TaxID=576610 RepID=UPI0013B05F03
MNRPILASIHTAAFQHNLGRVREMAPKSKIWSVIKARAYGHGFEAALKGLASTDGFALLDIEDAAWLREHGWKGRILLLEGFFHENELSRAAEFACDLVVHCDAQVDWLEGFKWKYHQPFNVFLKMNTGMNRLGFKPEAYRTAFHRLHAAGYHMHHMTHFSNADQVDRLPSVASQQELFNKTIVGLEGVTSLANSAAIMWHRNALGDWVRPGIMLYGASPTGLYADIQHANLQAVMQLESEVIDVQELEKGDRIGYGGRFEATGPMRVGIVACGYADGYPRHAKDGTPVWVANNKQGVICPLVGRVSMNMLAIDLRNAPEAGVGTSVQLWGDKVPVDDVAMMSDTIGYELLCAIRHEYLLLLSN